MGSIEEALPVTIFRKRLAEAQGPARCVYSDDKSMDVPMNNSAGRKMKRQSKKRPNRSLN